jgi:hypothetical protein
MNRFRKTALVRKDTQPKNRGCGDKFSSALKYSDCDSKYGIYLDMLKELRNRGINQSCDWDIVDESIQLPLRVSRSWYFSELDVASGSNVWLNLDGRNLMDCSTFPPF